MLARVRLIGVIVVALAAAALAVSTRLDLGHTSSELTERRGALATERARLTETEHQLSLRQSLASTLQPQLRTVRERLSKFEAALEDRTTERDGLQRSVDDQRGQLERLRAAVVATVEQLSLQGAQVRSLQLCLGGVNRALERASLDDADGALRSLERVSGDCRAAQADLAQPGPPS